MDDVTFERAKALFIEGVAQFEAGDSAEAERCFEASLALLPERASTLVNLGAVRVQLRQTRAGVACARSIDRARCRAA